MCDQMEAQGLLETVGTDPITGKAAPVHTRRRQQAEMKHKQKQATKH